MHSMDDSFYCKVVVSCALSAEQLESFWVSTVDVSEGLSKPGVPFWSLSNPDNVILLFNQGEPIFGLSLSTLALFRYHLQVMLSQPSSGGKTPQRRFPKIRGTFKL